MKHTFIVGVGSNIDPEKNVSLAEQSIMKNFELLKTSSFCMTKPLGFADQADFLNGAFLCATTMSMEECRAALKGIEIALGRIKTENKFGPRTIDLDIIIWDDDIIDVDFYTRDFLKKAVKELKISE